ncbi:hypothetical protein BURK1_02338 [Burkholderiales bacterium]|nr:hypothetical protein BURK1_02338 [Burkholderiales bacterium]
MTTRTIARSLAAAAVAALVGACAQAPATPDDAPSATAPTPPRVLRADGPREEAVRRHRDLAREARASGDLPTALDHLHIVAMLLPGDEGARGEANALRDQIRRGVREHLESARAAMRAGDASRASTSFLHVLALEPRNAEASRAMREIDRQNMARAQANRAARARVQDLFADARIGKAAPAAGRPAAADANNDGYDLEQRLEMFKAGDSAGALRELRVWVDAHPKDRATRQRIGAVVAERARELEGAGQREGALEHYEHALALRGEPQAQWSARVAALRKALGNDYYAQGVKLMRSDLPGAVRALEASVKFDPQNANAAGRLRDAKAARDKLSRMPAK